MIQWEHFPIQKAQKYLAFLTTRETKSCWFEGLPYEINVYLYLYDTCLTFFPIEVKCATSPNGIKISRKPSKPKQFSVRVGPFSVVYFKYCMKIHLANLNI